MFSLSSLRLENWPPCLRAPPRLDKENIFRGNSYQMEYMQEHTGRKKFMHLQIEYFVPKRKEMKWRHWVKKKLWSSGMTKRCNIHLNRILGIKGLLWKHGLRKHTVPKLLRLQCLSTLPVKAMLIVCKKPFDPVTKELDLKDLQPTLQKGKMDLTNTMFFRWPIVVALMAMVESDTPCLYSDLCLHNNTSPNSNQKWEKDIGRLDFNVW